MCESPKLFDLVCVCVCLFGALCAHHVDFGKPANYNCRQGVGIEIVVADLRSALRLLTGKPSARRPRIKPSTRLFNRVDDVLLWCLVVSMWML